MRRPALAFVAALLPDARWRVVALATILVAAGLAGCLRAVPAERPLAPPFEVVTVDGGRFALADHRGEVVLLDFMATWCIPCKEQIPAFHDVRARLDFVAVSLDVDPTEDDATLARFRDEVQADWPFARDTDALRIRYEAYTLPKQVLVDREGRIAWETRPGQVVDGARLEREVGRLL